MKKRVYAFVILSLILSTGLFSQINFQHDIPLSKAIELAQKENKKIFIDVYATWCGPCKFMSNTTFQDSTIGVYMNEQFINVKIDGEKPNGAEYGQKYQVRAYPTLIFLNPDGTLIRKEAGAYGVDDFIPFVEMSLDPSKDPINGLKEKFEKGTLNQKGKVEYAQMLAERQVDFTDVVASYWKERGEAIESKKDNDMMMFYLEASRYEDAHVKAMMADAEGFSKGMKQFYLEKVKEVIFAHSDDITKANVEQKKADMVAFLTAVLPPLKTDNPTLDEAGFINEVKGLYDQVAAEEQ